MRCRGDLGEIYDPPGDLRPRWEAAAVHPISRLFSPISPLYLPISPLYLPGEKGREFKESAALSDTIAAYLESIVATANELPPLWSISPALSPNYRRVTAELLPRLRALVAEVIAEI